MGILGMDKDLEDIGVNLPYLILPKRGWREAVRPERGGGKPLSSCGNLIQCMGEG